MRGYQYLLELLDGAGQPLGHVAVDPDWHPALECAAFAAMRHGLLPAVSGAPAGCVEPRWDDRLGWPFVAGFSVCIDGAEPEDLPLTYLGPQARAASAAFVASGALPPGGSFRYRVQAFPVPAPAGGPAVPADASLGFELEETTAPLALDDAVLSAYLSDAVRSGAAPHADEFPVFVSRRVLDETAERARANPDIEVGGILLGRLYRDRSLPEIFLVVTAQIPATHTVAGAASLTFTAESWAAVDTAIALRGRREARCGWHHSHPNWCRHCPLDNQRRCTRSSAFLSADDLYLHRVCWAQGGYNVALLITDNVRSGVAWSLYGWRRGVVAERGFHIIE